MRDVSGFGGRRRILRGVRGGGSKVRRAEGVAESRENEGARAGEWGCERGAEQRRDGMPSARVMVTRPVAGKSYIIRCCVLRAASEPVSRHHDGKPK